MTPNHKLTNVIKGRVIEDLQMNPAEVSMRFSDGSSMRVKVMESNSPPLKNRARIRGVSEQLVKFTVSCEDESEIVLTLADPGSSVTVRDADGKGRVTRSRRGCVRQWAITWGSPLKLSCPSGSGAKAALLTCKPV
jgi:hypothetical protein